MGAHVYPGCGKVRNGLLKFLEKPNYRSMISSY